MNPFLRILTLLPRMVPLGVVTIAVVLAWGQFYQIIGGVVCQASAALGSTACAAGEIPGPAALLDELQKGGDTEAPPLDDCSTSAGISSNPGACDADAPSAKERTVLVVGEAETFEYSNELARRNPAWDIDGGPDAVLELVARGIVRSDFRVMAEVDSLRALMKKFAGVPTSLADACLVRMTELNQRSVVLRLDSDFRVYRRNKRQVVPTRMPH